MVQRWVFTDPATSTTWTVPRNPKSMQFPSQPRSLDSLPVNVAGTVLALEQTPKKPADIQFSGSLVDQSHHDTLLAWTQRSNAITITDHLSRTWLVLLTGFEPTWKPGRYPWRGTYVVKGNYLL
jgi:hypothetical protein